MWQVLCRRVGGILKNWAQYALEGFPDDFSGMGGGMRDRDGEGQCGLGSHQSVEGEKQVNVGALFPGEGKQPAGNWLLYIKMLMLSINVVMNVPPFSPLYPLPLISHNMNLDSNEQRWLVAMATGTSV